MGGPTEESNLSPPDTNEKTNTEAKFVDEVKEQSAKKEVESSAGETTTVVSVQEANADIQDVVDKNVPSVDVLGEKKETKIISVKKEEEATLSSEMKETEVTNKETKETCNDSDLSVPNTPNTMENKPSTKGSDVAEAVASDLKSQSSLKECEGLAEKTNKTESEPSQEMKETTDSAPNKNIEVENDALSSENRKEDSQKVQPVTEISGTKDDNSMKEVPATETWVETLDTVKDISDNVTEISPMAKPDSTIIINDNTKEDKKESVDSVDNLKITELKEGDIEEVKPMQLSLGIVEQPSEPEVRQKKQSRQESVVDSESIPDIEDIDVKGNQITTEANKDLLDNDELDDDEYFDRMRRERSRSRSSYEETLAGMDPELLKELGIGEGQDAESQTPVPENAEMDLSQIPEETTEERMKRIEEKASGIVIEEDIVPRKSRSRSRSRSKSRPPNLDTVKEQKKEEILEARFYGIQPSLDTIKESPSTASMLGMLQGGMSSASINTVLQGSQSTASVLKEIPSQPGPREPSDSSTNEEPKKKNKKKAQRSDTRPLIMEDENGPVADKAE